MATNPLYNNNDSPNGNTAPTKAVNNQGVYVPRTHNTFDMSYFNFKTQRFGQYEPFFVMEGVPGDRIPFSNSHNVRSLPFATPFLSSLKLNKDYFLVPNQAIQPFTWEYIFKNPSQGDDVPDDVYNVFDLFGNPTSGNTVSLFDMLLDPFVSGGVYINNDIFVWTLLILENFFSSGSLLYNMGYRYNPILTVGSGDSAYTCSFDSYFDTYFREAGLSINISIEGRLLSFSSFDPELTYMPSNVILDLLRFFGSSATISAVNIDPTALRISGYSNLPDSQSIDRSFNMDRLCAYQLCYAQYYVNPQVDFLYNAQLYRDNFLSTVNNLDPEYNVDFFSLNGIRILYDAFSRNYYDKIIDYIFYNPGSKLDGIFDIINLLFGYKETLKFGDYFTDSRTRPLAVGDTSISVDDSVSVVDISKKIVLQRFLNNVIKLGNNFGDYLRGIFGTSPSPDYHFPKYIIHQEFDISGFETANTTSTDQGALTTNLLSGEDTYVFEIDIDMPCILLGISHFSVPLVYSQTKDRHFFHKDRFDFFNPMLQYTGDQPVYLVEKTDINSPESTICGYQSRYNEYKQRVSVASGGFIEKLPAWAFVVDDLFNDYSDLNLSLLQSPISIRHQPFQFNRFFKALSGYSLASAFHFIVVYNNKCQCNRPMEINPSIL